jgi:selenide,water dikinase
VRLAADLEAARATLLFDPQTSGGLLLALPEEQASALTERFAAEGEPIWRIGSVVAGEGIEVN